ncbi:MAG: hypothetical protein ABI373_00225, partial [Flavobacteriales bacterium]
MLILYVAYLLGILWTSNMSFAGLDLGIKATLLVFPLLYMFGRPLTDPVKVQRWFIGANALAVVICLFRAVFRSAELYLHAGPLVHPDGYALSVPFFASDFS